MKKKYFLIVNGQKVNVSKEIYSVYWKEKNHENYLKQLDRKNQLLLFSSYDHDGHFIDSIEDKTIDVEKLVETKMRIEDLNEAISQLNDEERGVIKRLYFDDESTRKVAEALNVFHQSIYRRNNKILSKLKKVLEKL